MMSMVDILLKENADLQAGYDAARLEIESLQARIAERDAQEYAIGAGGMEPLRKRCLHQISEPAQAQPAAQALDSVRVFWQQHTQADALSMTMAELHNDVELVIRAARGAAQAAPVDAESWLDLLAEARAALWQPANAALCERLDAFIDAARAAQKETND